MGPSFITSLKGDGLKFTFLAVVSSLLGLGIVVFGTRWLALPVGAAGGILAGSQTMSAAIGSAEQAVTSGVVPLAAGATAADATAMIALSYGITYIWGTVGIILICKYLLRWWGVDARKAAEDYEVAHGVPNLDDAGLSGYRSFDLRAYRLTNADVVGQTIAQFRERFAQYQIENVERGKRLLGADPALVLQHGDVIALGGSLVDVSCLRRHCAADVPPHRNDIQPNRGNRLRTVCDIEQTCASCPAHPRGRRAPGHPASLSASASGGVVAGTDRSGRQSDPLQRKRS